MNKTPVAVALSATAYTLLFFEQNAGLNFLLFNLLVIGLFFWVKPVLRLDRMFLFSVLLALFSSTFILIHGSDLAIFANVVSLLVLCATTTSPSASVINNFLQGICAVATAAILSLVGLFRRKNAPDQSTGRHLNNIITYLVPVFIALIFLALYRQANPLFEKFTEKLNLDFITLNWVVFALGGVAICCGLFLIRRQENLDELESDLDKAGDVAVPSRVWNQQRAFVLLLVLVNGMALVINCLDLKYLYLGAGLPQGITHKQFVHNGVGNLILSIVLGIVTLIYFLKRTERTPLIRAFVFLWIAQNFFIVLSTALRNNLYIQDALLTYKRIGVYYWLFMAATGLITTLIKIQKRKNTWYLFRVNSLIALIILVLSTAIDWDYFISSYNIKNRGAIASLDKKYMLSISEGNIGLLYSLRDDPEFNTDSVWHYSYGHGKNNKVLDGKLYSYLQNNQDIDWRSFNFRRERVFREISALREKGAFRRFSLLYAYPRWDGILPRFMPGVEWLEVSDLPDAGKADNFNGLVNLDSLSVNFLGLSDSAFIRRLQHVKYINYRSSDTIGRRLSGMFSHIAFASEKEKE